MHLRNPKDFWSGIMFAAIGFAFAVIVKIYDYPMGSASRMGPGYFPFVLGMALGVLGLVILLKSFVTDGERVSELAWRPIVWILGAVIVFGLTVKLIGLALAIIVLVLISAFGGHEFKLREQLIAAVILSAGSIGVFVYGLKLPFPIWPEFFG
jgi:hypothetical protein